MSYLHYLCLCVFSGVHIVFIYFVVVVALYTVPSTRSSRLKYCGHHDRLSFDVHSSQLRLIPYLHQTSSVLR